jgi:hypothetical protein
MKFHWKRVKFHTQGSAYTGNVSPIPSVEVVSPYLYFH